MSRFILITFLLCLLIVSGVGLASLYFKCEQLDARCGDLMDKCIQINQQKRKLEIDYADMQKKCQALEDEKNSFSDDLR